jgi:tetratricopeptide (TPR) repeat protein
MAIFTGIGFGCQQDSTVSERWLQKSLKTDADFSEALIAIKADMTEPESETYSPGEFGKMVLDYFPSLYDTHWDYVRSEHAKNIYDDLVAETVGLESSLGKNHELVLNVKESMLRLQLWRGQWDDAEAVAEELIRSFMEKPQSTSVRINLLMAQSMHAECLSMKGNNDQAGKILSQTYDQAKEDLSAHHPITLLMLESLARVWMSQSRFADVESIITRFLPHEMEEVGDQNPVYAQLSLQLARSYMLQARYENAENVFLSLVQTPKGIPGEMDPLNLASLDNLGELYLRTGRLKEAEEIALHLVKTWKITTHRSGKLMPAYPSSLQRLAEVYLEQDRLDEALETIHEALSLYYETASPGTFLELEFLAVEATVLCKAGQWDIAVEKQSKLVALSQTILGDHDTETRDRIIGLGAVYMFSGHYTEAEKILATLLRELERDKDRSNSNLLDCLEHLEETNSRQEKYKEAIHFAKCKLEVMERLPEKKSIEVIECMSDLASLHSKAEDFETALALRLHIVDKSKSEAGAVSEKSVDAVEELGNAYFDLENNGEAELQYQQALHICRALSGKDKEVTLCRILTSLQTTIADDPDRAEEVEDIATELRSLEASIKAQGADRDV